MRTRPRALIDVDGVLADYIHAILPIVWDLTGRVYKSASEWDAVKAFGLSEEQGRELIERTRGPGFCASIPVIAGSVAGIQALRKVADVYYITSPTHSRHWYYERTEWLIRHFGADEHQIGHVHHKEIVAGDVLVDDKPRHVKEWSRHHPDGLGILWTQPHNREEGDCLTTNSWEVVHELVKAGFGEKYRKLR